MEIYRVAPTGKEWLQYINNSDPNDILLDYGRSKEIVQFDFVNAPGYTAKYLVNGVIYFPSSTFIKCKILSILH